jgi:propionyl-CoA carboxylase alpha chain
MLAKVLAHGRTRAEAARRLSDALARAELHGLATNRDLLVTVLRHPEFLAGGADTGFLGRRPCTAPLVGPEGVRLAAAAAALAAQAERRVSARVLGTLPSGWRNNPSQAQVVRFDEGPEVRYRFDRHGRALMELTVDGEPLAAPRLHACAPDRVELEVDGVRRSYRVARGAVNTDEGQVDLHPAPRFADPAAAAAAAGSLTSPMPGTVVRVAVQEGAAVEAGALLVVLEAMKMEHEVRAPAAGTVAELRVQAGSQVETGAVLVVVEVSAG